MWGIDLYFRLSTYTFDYRHTDGKVVKSFKLVSWFTLKLSVTSPSHNLTLQGSPCASLLARLPRFPSTLFFNVDPNHLVVLSVR